MVSEARNGHERSSLFDEREPTDQASMVDKDQVFMVDKLASPNYDALGVKYLAQVPQAARR